MHKTLRGALLFAVSVVVSFIVMSVAQMSPHTASRISYMAMGLGVALGGINMLRDKYSWGMFYIAMLFLGLGVGSGAIDFL